MSSSLGKDIQVCCERLLRSRSDLLGETFDKRHAYAACLNRRDAEPYCYAACVRKLLLVNRAIFWLTFLTIDLKISTTCCIICVLAGVSLVYSFVRSVCMRVYSVRF